MHRVPSAIAGGVAGTTVLVLLLVLLEVQTREAIPVGAVVARFVGIPDRLGVGFLLFVAAGILLWPLLFVALEPHIPRGPDPAARATLFAGVLWIAFVVLGRGEIRGPLLIIYAAYTLFAHLTYGFVLGLVYAHVRDHDASSEAADAVG